MSSLIKLIQKRGQYKSQLTKFKSFMETYTESDHPKLLIRLEKIEQLWDKFDDVQTNIELLQDAEDNERTEFEDSFYDIVSKARQTVKKHEAAQQAQAEGLLLQARQSNSNTSTNQINVKLPTLNLPTFNGSYTEWISFRDSFASVINNNTELPEIDKFQYLRSALKAEPLQILKGLETWDLLKERYEIPRLIINSHIKDLMDIQAISRECHKSIRQMVDTIRANISALKSLDEPTDQWDTVMIYILNNKLDWKTKQLWQENLSSLGHTDKPTLNSFLSFLTNRCQTLEMIKSETNRVQNTTQNFRKNVTLAATTQIKCTFCKGTHYIFHCREFLKQTPEERYKTATKLELCINCLKQGHLGRNCHASKCKSCNKLHNTLLHMTRQGDKENKEERKANEEQQAIVSGCCAQQSKHIVLSTAEVLICAANGTWHPARVLLDSGSQSNFITGILAKKLNLKCGNINIPVHGINLSSANINKRTSVKIKSRLNNFNITLDCLILSKITDKLPQLNIDKNKLHIPTSIKLADPNFHNPGEIDLLIGAEIFWNVMHVGQVKLAKNQPILQKTCFGWIVAGPVNTNNSNQRQISCLAINEDIRDQLERFWQVEELHEKRKWTEDEEEAEEMFKNSVTRNKEGRFVVSILRKDDTYLQNTYEGALTRFHSIQKRLAKDVELQRQYIDFMNKYETLGHMSQIQDIQQQQEAIYLPHHPVVKNDSLTTKVRVVFDASFKDKAGKSLNDMLLVGPVIQDNLLNIILRFRIHEYVITADIAMMYRQILIREEDRKFQQILWTPKVNEETKTYQLNTVTYGTASAPFLAVRCLKQLAIEDGNKFPNAKRVLQTDFYMDDVLTGAKTVAEVAQLQKNLTELLNKGKFELRKWRSNSEEVLKNIVEEKSETELLILNKDDLLKTLGVLWNANSDTIHYKKKATNETRVTKITILSQITQLFDPLGLIGPVTIEGKIIMQQLWQLNLNWDETVPQSVYTKWMTYKAELFNVNQFEISRNVNPKNIRNDIDIHGFCDASEQAYGACIYASSINTNFKRETHLLCAKARVAPLKSTTLPRLELCGALILAKLLSTVQQSLLEKINKIYLWCDSTIVLAWLAMPPIKLKTFVANRVAEIQKLTAATTWQHISSNQNPADLISRGLSARDLKTNSLWWHGPQWLNQNEWPKQERILQEQIPEIKVIVTAAFVCKDNILERYSSIIKLQRILCYCVRFIKRYKRLDVEKNQELTIEEINDSLKLIIKLVQGQVFFEEIKATKEKHEISRKSKLFNLNPFLDQDGILRVGGRLQNSNISIDHRHPYILPSQHHITHIIIENEHQKLKHCGQEQLLASIRTKYWPLAGRRTIRKIIHKCLICFKFKARGHNHIMGNLPQARVQGYTSPFNICGIDYTGPIQIREGRRRGRMVTTKAYISVFVCFSTKAIHIELVTDLTTDSFIGALRRFVTRRGLCKEIYSDNATNFVGESKKLNELNNFLNLNNNKIKTYLTNQNIKWNFIPPRTPHFGGLWESAVKSLKRHFLKITQNIILTFEECYTLLTEIEAVMNSRPLTPLSTDPQDLTPLTPAHFLIGKFPEEPAAEDYTTTPRYLLNRWSHIQKMKIHFWQRWYREYLLQLQQRTKWQMNSSNIKIGTMVLLVEDNLPPLHWRIGRIQDVHPGQDGVIRIVIVKTSAGEVKRPVAKVCILPNQ